MKLYINLYIFSLFQSQLQSDIFLKYTAIGKRKKTKHIEKGMRDQFNNIKKGTVDTRAQCLKIKTSAESRGFRW